MAAPLEDGLPWRFVQSFGDDNSPDGMVCQLLSLRLLLSRMLVCVQTTWSQQSSSMAPEIIWQLAIRLAEYVSLSRTNRSKKGSFAVPSDPLAWRVPPRSRLDAGVCRVRRERPKAPSMAGPLRAPLHASALPG